MFFDIVPQVSDFVKQKKSKLLVGTIDSTMFSDGNTYDVAVRNDGRRVIANVAYEYTTVVSGPTV